MLIASRSLKLEGADDVAVRIFAPEQQNDGTWFCAYEIDWPEGKWASRAGGADSIQALFLALQMIGSDIYTSEYHQAGLLSLEGAGGGYGFPVPTALRDLLAGDDKEFV